MGHVQKVLRDIAAEVEASELKHGDQTHLAVTDSDSAKKYADLADRQKAFLAKASEVGITITWQDIALEEVFECFAETDPAKIRAEAIQAAAMFVQIARQCDRDADR